MRMGNKYRGQVVRASPSGTAIRARSAITVRRVLGLGRRFVVKRKEKRRPQCSGMSVVLGCRLWRIVGSYRCRRVGKFREFPGSPCGECESRDGVIPSKNSRRCNRDAGKGFYGAEAVHPVAGDGKVNGAGMFRVVGIWGGAKYRKRQMNSRVKYRNVKERKLERTRVCMGAWAIGRKTR